MSTDLSQVAPYLIEQALNAAWLNVLTNSEAAQTMHDIIMRCAVSWPTVKHAYLSHESTSQQSINQSITHLTSLRKTHVRYQHGIEQEG